MMKQVYTLLFVLTLGASAAMAQTAPSKAPQASSFTDIYHIHFNKAALGQASALGDSLKVQDAKAPMPGHFMVLRHQEGDDWDYCVIEHLGTKATIDAAAAPLPNPASRNLSAWHTDTFAVGPSWAEFSRLMGVTPETKAGSANSLYVVAVWRAAPGHRDQLQEALKRTDPVSKVSISSVVMQHVEGGPWNFLAIDRYNSWQDFATDEAANVPKTGTGKDGWSEVRQHGAYHQDTLTDRIAPK
jgi:hypothetical protein